MYYTLVKSQDQEYIRNQVTPIRRRHDSNTQVGVNIAVEEDPDQSCTIYDYLSYSFSYEEKVKRRNTAKNVATRLFTFGIVGVEDEYYYRIIRTDHTWSENSCEPGVIFNEKYDSYPVKEWFTEDEFTGKQRAHYSRRDDDYWEEYGGDVSIFGQSVDWWKRNTVISDIPVTIVDTRPGPTTVQPLDTSGLKVDQGSEPEYPLGEVKIGRDFSSQPESEYTFSQTAIKSDKGTYPQIDTNKSIETTLIPSTTLATMTGREVFENFPQFMTNSDFPIYPDESYSITNLSFTNPRNNPSYSFKVNRSQSNVIIISGTYGEARYMIKRLGKVSD